MTLDELLTAVGNNPLKGHDWAEGLIATLNVILPPNHQVGQDTTGAATKILLSLLPAEESVRVLTASVDVPSGQLEMAAPPPTVVAAVVTTNPRRPSSTIALICGVVLVAIALMMAVTISVISVRTDKAPDPESVKGILSILGDATKTAVQQSSQDQQNQNH